VRLVEVRVEFPVEYPNYSYCRDSSYTLSKTGSYEAFLQRW